MLKRMVLEGLLVAALVLASGATYQALRYGPASLADIVAGGGDHDD